MTSIPSEFFPWDDAYLTGITSIDNQHKGLFLLVNEFHQAIESGSDIDQLRIFLDQLGNYARDHFTHEEHLMESYSYPKFQYHASLHEHGFMAILKLSQSTPDVELVKRVLLFTKQWISEHVLQEDRGFINFLIEQHGESFLMQLDTNPL